MPGYRNIRGRDTLNQPDGSFTVVGMPGRGIVTAQLRRMPDRPFIREARGARPVTDRPAECKPAARACKPENAVDVRACDPRPR